MKVNSCARWYHQHLVCGLHLAGPDRVAFLGEMVVIHATAVVAEVTQCLANFRLASPLSQQIPEGIYHFVDTVGTAGKNTALALKPLGTGLFVRHRGRELAYASPPAQIPACALTHGAPASDDDEGQLARLGVFKPIAVARETPTQSRLRKCVLHCLVGSAE